MKKKLNCWEVKLCGREPGGINVYEFGVCPAAEERAADGINSGINGGRSCWVIAGTFCRGTVQGSTASKIDNCLYCEFYAQVQKEEGKDFMMAGRIFEEINKKKGKS